MQPRSIKGDPADATSLNNMKATIQWLKRCNELRSQHGLAPLMVSDRLMAMAQADANYSDTVIGHAMQFSLGENCAWNYGSDPFIQWYDQEKAQYEATKDSGKQDIILILSVLVIQQPVLQFVQEEV